MHQIQGLLNVNVGVQYTYTVIPSDGTSYIWTVSGCEIISGQGTTSITVLWTLAGQGSIQVELTYSGGDDIVIIEPVGG